tara:strand:+ start:13733 stop:14878 length:1146 start_codon:yes stop_codon:yes gene_type:complete
MKIFLITSTRADFSLLKNLIHQFKKNINFDLKVIATGTHFSKKYGFSFNEIKKEKINVFKRIKISNNVKSPKFLLKDLNNISIKITSLLEKHKPNLIILLGDRYEVLGSSLAAYISKTPVAHIHGGEITVGSLDDGFRHCISKLSAVHFVSHETYKKRLTQLGENPKTIFNVGALGVENIHKTKFISKKNLEKLLKIKLQKKILSICLQPEISKSLTIKLVDETLSSLKKHDDKSLIFTMPGADLNNEIIFNKIKYFVKNRDNSFLFKSLGSQRYLSLLKISDAFIGNSSSGIIEMPSFKKPTINIGKRQEGRIRSNSIMDVSIKKELIQKKIRLIYSQKLKTVKNPYKKNNTSKKIISIIKNFNFKKYKVKKFYDISYKL